MGRPLPPVPGDAPSLAKVQRLFGQALLPATQDSKLGDLYRQLGGAPGIDPRAGLAVYRNNAIGGQLRALKSIYPACLRILGEACFRTLGRDYLQAHPSTTPDLNDLGERFADLLEEIVATRGEFADYPYLPDLARLEWAWHRAYYAADAAPFDWTRLQDESIDQQRLLFALQPGLALLASDWPLLELWRAGGQDRDEASTQRHGLCVYRSSLEPGVEAIDSGLFALLEGLRDELPLGALADAGLQVQRIGELLQRGWLVSAHQAPERSSS